MFDKFVHEKEEDCRVIGLTDFFYCICQIYNEKCYMYKLFYNIFIYSLFSFEPTTSIAILLFFFREITTLLIIINHPPL